MSVLHFTKELRAKPTYKRLFGIAQDAKNASILSTVGDQEALGLPHVLGESVAQTLLRALDLALSRDTREPSYPSPRD